MSSTRKETNPLKRRKLWWLSSGFFWFIGVFYIGTSAMFMLLILVKSKLGAVLAGTFWLIMLPIVIWLYRRTIWEDFYVDQSIVDKTRRELVAHRIKVRKEFLENEITLLERGQKTLVLDVWRLDAELAKRHSFFRHIDAIFIDPGPRELHIRIQVGDSPENSEQMIQALWVKVHQFMLIISADPYLMALKKFFDSLIMEVYGFRSDEHTGLIPYPLFSLEVNAGVFWRLFPSLRAPEELRRIGNFRFKNGEEIIPHRSIAPPHRGTK